MVWSHEGSSSCDLGPSNNKEIINDIKKKSPSHFLLLLALAISLAVNDYSNSECFEYSILPHIEQDIRYQWIILMTRWREPCCNAFSPCIVYCIFKTWLSHIKNIVICITIVICRYLFSYKKIFWSSRCDIDINNWNNFTYLLRN